jgi:hypothetical protein
MATCPVSVCGPQEITGNTYIKDLLLGLVLQQLVLHPHHKRLAHGARHVALEGFLGTCLLLGAGLRWKSQHVEQLPLVALVAAVQPGQTSKSCST